MIGRHDGGDRQYRTRFSRGLAVVSWMLAILMVSGVASAEGRVHWKNTKLKERDNHSWRLEMTIYMRHAPDIPEVPAKFEFEPTAYYERAMVDGNKIIEHRVPLQNQQSIITDEDIGFLDPGSGKIQKRTRFSFKITRDHGFEAGEYKVTIRDARNGRVLGRPIKLTLEGKNKVVDRRTMVFSGNIGGKKKKKKSDGEMQHVNRNGEVTNDTSSGAAGAGNAQGADNGAAGSSTASEDEPGDDDSASSEQVKNKPGGCGCRLANSEPGGSPLFLAPLGLALALALRRRRKRAA